MKKIYTAIIATALIASTVLGVAAQRADGYSWYIKKRGNLPPDFPKEATMVDENHGYYIDKCAANNGEKIIYLTFDAGYDNGNVEKTLDILRENNVPGAFFILSNIIIKNTDTVKRMFEEGHLVCNHTKNHKYLGELTDSEIEANLSALKKLCYDRTGYQMVDYFRFPEGRFDERTIKKVSDLGYSTFFWSMCYADWDNGKQMSPESAIAKLKNSTHNGAVILLHPTSETNVKILPTLIQEWKDQGYTFGSLTDLVEKNS